MKKVVIAILGTNKTRTRWVTKLPTPKQRKANLSLQNPLPIYDMDIECVDLCIAMNRLPGIETSESCCGHSRRSFLVFFRVTNHKKRGFRTLARLMCNRYHNFANKGWRIQLYHGDHPKNQVMYLLVGPKNGADQANELAKRINNHVDNKVNYYNILYNK